ncbi:MAG: SIS domain-containing protein [Acutalibacteraceae bacterium]
MNEWVQSLCDRYPELENCREGIEQAIACICASYENGGKLLIGGNGGSCADAEHIAGELMKGFLKMRPLPTEQKESMRRLCPELGTIPDSLQRGLPVIALHEHAAFSTAFVNDVEPQLVFAQQVLVFGHAPDVLLGISTSGNSANILAAAKTARGLGLPVIGLTGRDGGRLAAMADICIRVPATETYRVQEYHQPIYHAICAQVEQYFFRN